MQFLPDDIPKDAIHRGYTHTTMGSLAGPTSVEQTWYVSFMEELRDDLRKDLPPGREADLDAELQRIKQEYITRRLRVLRTRSSVVSVAVAGGSKFNSKQASSRGSALDRAEAAFSDWLKQAKHEAAVATGVADVRAAKEAAQSARKEEARKVVNERVKELRRAQNKLPIINTPDGATAITKAEWAATHSDYKGISVSAEGTYRYRSMVKGGALVPVFLSDQKVVPVPVHQPKTN